MFGGKGLGAKPPGTRLPAGKLPASKSTASKSTAKGKAASRTPAVPRERMTLDGPWEWAFDRMLGRKRAAEALAKQQAKQTAKPAGKRVSDGRTPPGAEA